MWLFVGLGNPEPQYQHNRHNIGFMAVDEICHRHNFSEFRKKFQGLVSEGTIAGEKVLMLKPLTYMNLSGQAVQSAISFYKIPLENVIVFHDDLDLAAGKIRTKFAGGAAGHNGLRSIDDHLGKDYWRVRLGIGRPAEKNLVHDYVLGNFAKADDEWLKKILSGIAEYADKLVQKKMDDYMTKIAETMQPEKTAQPKKEKENGI
jgi:PTH1 family peptidyl-tRNA hydrolase